MGVAMEILLNSIFMDENTCSSCSGNACGGDCCPSDCLNDNCIGDDGACPDAECWGDRDYNND